MIINRITNIGTSVDERYLTPTSIITLEIDPEQLQDSMSIQGPEFTAQRFFAEFLEARDFYNRNKN